MTLDAEYIICTGQGGGMFTLRCFYDHAWDGTPKMAHIKNLSRDPYEALQKARDYIVSQGGDPDGLFSGDVPVLADFDPEKASKLNTWGECDPRRQHDLSLIAKGEMPFGKYSGQAIADIPIEYFANWYLDGDIDTKRSCTVKERIRLQLLSRRDEFMAVVDANASAEARRQAEIEAKRSQSMHVAKIGDRIDIRATIQVCKQIDGFYGISYFMILENKGGDVFKYVGSANLGDKGQTITLKATVKDHCEYDQVKQTVISRPKIQE
tara:strand:+ start:13346 stop:14143 length:798 start_codon:yes stop_codon:yes gene_type:complete